MTRPLPSVVVALSLLAGSTVYPSPAVAQEPKPLEFKWAKLNYQDGDQKREEWVSVWYEANSLALRPNDKRKTHLIRTMTYDTIKSAEYTFGKSPRVAAALLVTPFFLFSSSKSHWLTIKTADDYALLRLDKSNYKLVIAELEKRAKIKVETVGENK